MTSAPDPQAFYDEMWRRYAHLDAVSPAAFHRRRMVAQLARRHAASARRILDVGCGQGELLRELERALPGARVAGADLSAQSIADSQKRNPGADLFVLDLTAPDFDAVQQGRLGRYDLVVCSEVVEHIDDDALAVRRLCSLLAPGGTLILTVPGGRMSRFDKVIGHHRHYRSRDLERLLGAGRLQVVSVLAWGFPFQNLYRSAVRVASVLAIPAGGAPAKAKSTRDDQGVVGRALGQVYTVFGRSLKPLFYLNASRWGEQMLAVARRPEAHDATA